MFIPLNVSKVRSSALPCCLIKAHHRYHLHHPFSPFSEHCISFSLHPVSFRTLFEFLKMEAYTLNSSDSSTSTGNALNKVKKPRCQRNRPAIPKHRSSQSAKALPRPWKKKPPVAPPPPTPARVYSVDYANFKEVVQMLTGADPKPLPPPGRLQLQRERPSPIATPDVLEAYRDLRVCFQGNSLDECPFHWKETREYSAGSSSTEALFTNSSSSPYDWSSTSPYDWSSSISLMSPGTLSSFGM